MGEDGFSKSPFSLDLHSMQCVLGKGGKIMLPCFLTGAKEVVGTLDSCPSQAVEREVAIQGLTAFPSRLS